MSLIFWSARGHPKPWLLGMAVALVSAEVVDCRVQWPNDLVAPSSGKKLGGILTEVEKDVPVIGLGMNLNQSTFPPELESVATSLRVESGAIHSALELARMIVDRLHEGAVPLAWADLAVRWSRRDATQGKLFKTPAGTVVTAEAVGANGELLAFGEEGLVTVYAGDAWFGA